MTNTQTKEIVVYTAQQAANYLEITEDKFKDISLPYIKYPDIDEIFYYRPYLDEYKVRSAGK